jgi:hypothetical protein
VERQPHLFSYCRAKYAGVYGVEDVDADVALLDEDKKTRNLFPGAVQVTRTDSLLMTRMGDRDEHHDHFW